MSRKPRTANGEQATEAYQNDTAFQMYEATHGTITLRVVERMRVADTNIIDIVFVTDQKTYERFKAGE